MSATGSVARALLGLALSAFGSTVAAQYPEHHIRIVRHDLVVDVPRQQAVFNLWFSEAPDLTTLDEHGDEQTSFVYYLELPERRNFHLRAGGSPELAHPLIRVFSGEPGDGVVARRVTAGTTDQWGPIVATADIQQLGSRVSFRLPLSIFDYDNFGNENWKPYEGNSLFAVHYFLESFRGGVTAYSLARGVATVGTVDAPLVVQRRDVRAGNGSKRRVVIAHVLSFPSTEENPGTFFFAEPIDVGSVRFGPNRASPVGNELKDVNGDGLDDLVLTFNAPSAGLSCIDTDVRLTGEMPSQDGPLPMPEGTVFIGRATLSPAPCN
jgi:hypothetical protein